MFVFRRNPRFYERFRAKIVLKTVILGKRQEKSSFCKKSLSIAEVALIFGHKDFRMLLRYAHMKLRDMSLKLISLSYIDGYSFVKFWTKISL